MSFLRTVFLCLLALCTREALTAQTGSATPLKVTSPNGQITLLLFDAATKDANAQTDADSPAPNGVRYAVEFHGKRLMAESKLGLELAGQPALGPGMKTTATQPSSVDESYTIPVGKTSTVHDHYNALHADFQDAASRRLSIEARVYDDGVAFRYLVPEQPSLQQVRITHELTEFTYVTDATSYPLLLDGFRSAYEDDYQLRTVSSLHHDWLVGLPYLAEEPGLGWVAITEANIDNYAGMYLRRGNESFSVRAELAPRVDKPGVAVETTAPFASPWRVLMIGDEPGRLIESNIVLNLNPPSKIADTSWIRPGKSAWDW